MSLAVDSSAAASAALALRSAATASRQASAWARAAASVLPPERKLLAASTEAEAALLADASWVEAAGRVWLTRKGLWTLGCAMDFRWLPYDRQECYAQIKSFRHPSTELSLRFWAGAQQPSHHLHIESK